ncbi:MAG: hypothetical protein HON04_10090 [Planctomicrobium sp.]|nr:hypothetical protein [Planctomicrobium sp.]
MMKYRNPMTFLLIIAAGFIGLAILNSRMDYVPTGTFAADYYYLPLREYVDPADQYEMEVTVINLWNAKRRRDNTLKFALHLVPMVCILISLYCLWKPDKS